jgi:YD repeat-containing protein
VIAVIDTLGRITRTYYDELNRPEVVVRNLVGQAIGTADPPEHDPQFPDQNVRTDTVYDENGSGIATIDPLGVIGRTYYDDLNRIIAAVDNLVGQSISAPNPPDRDPMNPDQNVRMDYGFDSLGNRISLQDANGIITSYEFDSINRLQAVVENYTLGMPADHQTNVRTEYTYNAVGNLKTITDANNTNLSNPA